MSGNKQMRKVVVDFFGEVEVSETLEDLAALTSLAV